MLARPAPPRKRPEGDQGLYSGHKDKPVSLSQEEVRRYLEEHPSFLVENEDLLRSLTPPRLHGGNQVVDFQRYMLERLQMDLARFDDYRMAVIAATRSNLVSQQQVHMAVLTAFDALSLEHLIHVITHDWVDILDLDAVMLCTEQGPLAGLPGIQVLTPGEITQIMGDEGAFLLRDNIPEASRDLFGPAAELVRAEALVRLAPGETRGEGMLAMGSRNPDHFAPGQGTELLRFLGAMTERLLDLWLTAES